MILTAPTSYSIKTKNEKSETERLLFIIRERIGRHPERKQFSVSLITILSFLVVPVLEKGEGKNLNEFKHSRIQQMPISTSADILSLSPLKIQPLEFQTKFKPLFPCV